MFNLQLAFLKARSVALEIDEPKLLGRIYENLGNLYERQELQDSVLFFYNKALLYYQQAQDSVGVGISLRNIGRSYLHLIWIVLNGIIKSHYNGFITTDI